MNDDINNSTWKDIKSTWSRVGGVLAAVGVIATFITKVFNTPPELTYSIFAGLGVILLMISFYVDKQTKYTHQEIIKYEQQARKDFTDAIHEIKNQFSEHKKESENVVNKLLTISKDTRKDTLRIQLMMLIHDQPDNVDSILKVAETYFVTLEGDWYMTNEFSRWANDHNVTIPLNIIKALNIHKEEI